MPTTVNGVGTHYYGRKNRAARMGVCRSCNRQGMLESYDTRLWFVIIFIPVIPLGRKRIIDQCPYCRRHYAAKAAAFEQARQLEISGSQEKFRREPTPEAALEVHARLLGFHEHDQAAEFRKLALEKFPESAELRAGLASQLQQVAAYDKAGALYEEALALDPELPEARIGVAQHKIAQGSLDEARQLLDFMEVPGAGQRYPLGVIDVLAGSYQKARRHEEALALATCLLRELPEIGQQHDFRSFVRKSERALGNPESILPAQKHSLRGLFRAKGSPYPGWQRGLAMIGLAGGLLAAGMAISNDYIRRHRSLHVVNACGLPVDVQVDDQPAVKVGGLRKLILSEGRHHIKLSGPVSEAHDISLESTYFDRWFGKPLWILNPGGEAVIGKMTIVYSANPQPPDVEVFVGKPFLALPHIDYPFEEPPQKMHVDNKATEIRKTTVEQVQGQDREAFLRTAQTDRTAALDFAEHRLRRQPLDAQLLEAYGDEVKKNEEPRVAAFLKEGLSRRPVQVEWHRMYQTLEEKQGHAKDLYPLYDGFLAAEPTNAALLYLRGRIEPDWDRQGEFYKRSLDADAKLGWTAYGLGMREVAEGHWAESAQLLTKAHGLGVDHNLLASPLHIARLAIGEGQALVQEYRQTLSGNPMEILQMALLCDALASMGEGDKVQNEVAQWAVRLPNAARGPIQETISALALYLRGEFEQCASTCRGGSELQKKWLGSESLLALDRASEVAADPAFEPIWDDNHWAALSLSLGLSLAGKAEDAAHWRDRACKVLGRQTDEMRQTAKVLGGAEPPSLDAVRHLVIATSDKALVLAVLAEKYPAKSAEYRTEAARYMIGHMPPIAVVQRALQVKTASAP